MQQFVAVVFGLVYLGMIFGGLPGLALNRTAAALLGAIALLAGGALDAQQAWASVDMPTMSLLFGLMLVSAQLRLSGFYDLLARRIAAAQATPQRLRWNTAFGRPSRAACCFSARWRASCSPLSRARCWPWALARWCW